MKTMILLICLALAGCSGLNVSWVATATYNTPAMTQVMMKPGVTPEISLPLDQLPTTTPK